MNPFIHKQQEITSPDAIQSGQPSKAISRRKLLSTLGAAGIALAAGETFLTGSSAQAASASTTIYNVKEFGARGNSRYDQDDTPFIQNAIDSAAQTGGIVFIPAGMYFLQTPLRLSSNITLMGSGSNSILHAAMNKISVLNGSAVNQVHIHRLSFQGLGSFASNSMPLIECGISLTKATNIRITDCLFSMIDNGVKSIDSSGVVVDNCFFDGIIGALDYDNQGYGIWCNNGNDHTLVNNRFTMMYQSCITLLNGSSHAIIANNHIQKSYQSGIDLSSGAKEEPCQFNIIRDNTIEGLVNSSGNKGYTFGIRLRGGCISNLITGNILNDIDDQAITLEGTGDAKKNRPQANTLTDNQISSIRDKGVVLINAYSNRVSNNLIRNCKGDGILLSSKGKDEWSYCDNNHLVTNSITNCSGAPLRIADASCRETIIYGNIGSGNTEKLIDKGTNTNTAAL
ncbi:right-handed parallel beta-helix repeat-containing protein [Paenibacillus sp. N3.4]|uniref:right-handed parallel beta-helix repeat-containing protein n=1 Tax=Paenibacillus sp. N3.4 TaxID=2603222 RepID=UPI0016503EDB|nr:right-handed parallel beta-helix repeat-containing protein [Paenibacillus sp. N3.4]